MKNFLFSPNLKRRLFLRGSLFAASLWLSSILFDKSQSTEPPLSVTTSELVSNNTAFALDLYRYLSSESGNLFFSPYSISIALAMTYAGAREETAIEMAEVLKFSLSPDRLHPTFADLRSILEANATEDYQLAIANRLWGQADYPFLERFLELIQSYYGSGLETVDFFKETEAARQTINTWVEQQTNGKIKDLLAPNILSPLTQLVLTNAIYFKAKWLEPFRPDLTQEEPFTIAPGQQISVPMMKGTTSVSNYVVLGDVKLLELFYLTMQQSMVIILPDRVDGLARLEQRLTPSLLAEWLAALDKDNSPFKFPLTTWLPKFKVSSELELKKTLTALGMTNAFGLNANFSGMDGGITPPIYLQNIIHKAFVDVNELGTEAAAATGVVAGIRSSRGSIIIDRPFLLLIRDIKSGSILFIGRVVNPLS